MRALYFLIFFLSSLLGIAQSEDHDTGSFPITEGIVDDIAAGDHYTVIRGNTLTKVGPYLGNAVVLNAATGEQDKSFPLFHARVSAIISDGSGGWFVAGLPIDNYYIFGLAHIKADKTLDENWGGAVNGLINALVLENGVLYVGGSFTNANDFENADTRNRLAAFNATTGALLDWNPGANGEVKALAVSTGVVYAGGTFTMVNGQNRKNIAGIDAATGTATSWNPGAEGTGSSVHDIVISGNTVYAGGLFTTAGGASRRSIAALDKTTNTALAWNPDLDASAKVNSIVLSGSTLMLGGNFTTVGGQSRKHLAAVQTDNAALTAFNAMIDNAEVSDLALSGTTLYVAGSFSSVNNAEKKGLATFNVTTGAAVSWNVAPQVSVLCLAVSGTTVYAGSNESFRIGWKPSNQFAVINNETGETTLTDLEVDGGDITKMVIAYDVLYLAGTFSEINGTSRDGLAAINLNSGSVLDWAPVVNDRVYDFAIKDTRLFLGGSFTSVNGSTREGLAAVNLATGNLLPWTCNVDDGEVHALRAFEDRLYVGGTFSSINSIEKHRLAAINIDNGTVLSWNSENFDLEDVTRIEATPDVVIVNDLTLAVAGFDAETSDVMFAIPADIRGFVAVGNSLIVGGPFDFIDPFMFNGLAQISLTTALPTEWIPDVLSDALANPSVYAVARNAEYVFVGGGFRGMAFEKRTGFGAYAIVLPQCSAFGEISFNDVTLTAPAGGDSYQWLVNDSLMTDADLQTLDPDLTKDGYYAVVVTEAGCPNVWRYYEYEAPEPEEPVLGVEKDSRSAIKLYPNPVRDLIRFDVPESERVYAVTIRNTLGQPMPVKADAQGNIVVSDLAAGPYIVILKTTSGNRSFKVIKTH